MTKQHFIAFAKDIRSLTDLAKATSNEPASVSQSQAMFATATSQCNPVCRIAPQFNPQFNPKKFREVCGL